MEKSSQKVVETERPRNAFRQKLKKTKILRLSDSNNNNWLKAETNIDTTIGANEPKGFYLISIKVNVSQNVKTQWN